MRLIVLFVNVLVRDIKTVQFIHFVSSLFPVIRMFCIPVKAVDVFSWLNTKPSKQNECDHWQTENKSDATVLSVDGMFAEVLMTLQQSASCPGRRELP